MKIINILALVLVIVGGLNWGLVGMLQFNLVTSLFGEASMLSNIVFILVGLSAVYVAAVVLPKEMK
ncbi:MAG: hypothetical protein RLZZ455_556 [Candidatus Parcubacteria bacterium]|jgi:uncharacterized membrane protein YuzA (DUF378 family)